MPFDNSVPGMMLLMLILVVGSCAGLKADFCYQESQVIWTGGDLGASMGHATPEKCLLFCITEFSDANMWELQHTHCKCKLEAEAIGEEKKMDAPLWGRIRYTDNTSLCIAHISIDIDPGFNIFRGGSPSCECKGQFGGCIISNPAPSMLACHCYIANPMDKLRGICSANVVDCFNAGDMKCMFPDTGKVACFQGQGDCNGYTH